MTEQLFRFSVLRAAELRSELSPLVVAPEHQEADDALVAVATRAMAWLNSTSDLNTATTGQLVSALDVKPGQWATSMTTGLVVLANRNVGAALSAMAQNPSTEGRRTFSTAVDFLTASALLADLAGLADATVVGEWIRLHPVQIDFEHLLPANLWRPKRALVRTPAVSDHFVMREELIGYELGEIEDIKNYLKGELKDHSLRYLSVSEEEVITEVETENNRTTESATQQRNSMKSARTSEDHEHTPA